MVSGHGPKCTKALVEAGAAVLCGRSFGPAVTPPERPEATRPCTGAVKLKEGNLGEVGQPEFDFKELKSETFS